MKIKRSELIQLADRYIGNDSLEAQNQIMIKIATARCARLSYMTFDGEIDYKKDIKLHDRLLKDKHCFDETCEQLFEVTQNKFDLHILKVYGDNQVCWSVWEKYTNAEFYTSDIPADKIIEKSMKRDL